MNAIPKTVCKPALMRCAAALAVLLYGGEALCQPSSITPISVPAGAGATAVSALNNRGHIAGYYINGLGAQRAFSWDGTNALDLGTLGGSVSVATDLNDSLEVVGYSSAVGDLEYRAFRAAGQTLVNLGTLGGSVSAAFALNETGGVTGYSFTSLSGVDYHAVLSRNGLLTDLGTLGGSMSSGTDINELDQVAGDSTLAGDLDNHGFLYDAGALIDLGTLGGTYSSAIDLNNLGEVTGQSSLPGESEAHAFLYRQGVMQDLGTLGGTWSAGYALNDSSVVIGDGTLAGDVVTHGFAWSNGQMTDLGDLGGHFSSAWAINNAGLIVGVSSNSLAQRRAVAWRNNTIVDLNSVLPPNSGWVLEQARFVNEAGQIVGTGVFQGQPAWYRLDFRPTENRAPLADAGADALVECGANALLDGSASIDPEGELLAYAWFEGGQLLGNAAALRVSLASGVHVLTLRVTDPHGLSAEDTVVVTVQDTTAPILQAIAPVKLSGCQVPAPNLLANVVVEDNCTPRESLVLTQTPPAGTALELGGHDVVLSATDAAGNVGHITVRVEVADTTAPALSSLTATPSVLRQPNKQLVPVVLSVAATDGCDPAPVSRIIQVQSSEPVTGPGDKTSPDWNITGPLTLEVRSELGQATVRTYTITVVCTDRSGNKATRQVTVTVTKNKN